MPAEPSHSSMPTKAGSQGVTRASLKLLVVAGPDAEGSESAPDELSCRQPKAAVNRNSNELTIGRFRRAIRVHGLRRCEQVMAIRFPASMQVSFLSLSAVPARRQRKPYVSSGRARSVASGRPTDEQNGRRAVPCRPRAWLVPRSECGTASAWKRIRIDRGALGLQAHLRPDARPVSRIGQTLHPLRTIPSVRREGLHGEQNDKSDATPERHSGSVRV